MKSIAAIVAGMICTAGFPAGADPLTPGKHSDPVISHPYQETVMETCAARQCTLTAPATTKNETLIQHVTCLFSMPGTEKTNFASLGVQSSGVANPLQVFSYAAAGGIAYRGISGDTFLFLKQGQQPRIDITTTAPAGPVNCTLSGYFE